MLLTLISSPLETRGHKYLGRKNLKNDFECFILEKTIGICNLKTKCFSICVQYGKYYNLRVSVKKINLKLKLNAIFRYTIYYLKYAPSVT